MMQYKPIDCNFYDKLEAFATSKKICLIIYKQADEIINIHSKIVNLETINKEEFMVLEDDVRVRLDYLVSVDGDRLDGYC